MALFNVMETTNKGRTQPSGNRGFHLVSLCLDVCLFVMVAASTMMLSSCGGGSSSNPAQDLSVAGNWQFTMAPPSDGSFLGGLEGGFLLQTGGAVKGTANYAVSLTNLLVPCSNGSAPITGTFKNQAVSLSAAAGTQTLTLTGTLSLDGLSMSGTYDSTAGTAGNGSPCGTAQTGLQWSAVFVQPLEGSIQGTFHSAGGAAGLNEQEFLVTGALDQADNTGAGSAAITGNLSFVNVLTNKSDYPCFASASVTGQVSGNLTTLELVGADGTEWGFIGEPFGSLGGTGISPVTLQSRSGGYVLQGAGPSYLVATTACPGNLSSTSASGDFGNICLALNGASACQEPITLAPSYLTFSSQMVGAPATTQVITLTDVSASSLNLTLNLTNNSGALNFTETDTCGANGLPSGGQPFQMIAAQFCAVAITFQPLEICSPGTPPDKCPAPLTATLTVTNPDNEMIFSVPITGTATSGDSLLGRAFDFGAELNVYGDGSNQYAERHAEIY
jgi:hypothetical protein